MLNRQPSRLHIQKTEMHFIQPKTMDSCQRTWWIWLTIVLILHIILIQAVNGQDNTNKVITLEIKNRKVKEPKSAIKITQNDIVELHCSSDETMELHLHGYDKKIKIPSGKTQIILIKAHATGRFPITSHGWGDSGHSHHALIYLEVYPR